MNNFRDLLENDSVYVFDGAVGTRLYDKGVYINRSYDELNLTAPDLVGEVHEEYVKAGADIIEHADAGAAVGREVRVFDHRDRGSHALVYFWVGWS